MTLCGTVASKACSNHDIFSTGAAKIKSYSDLTVNCMPAEACVGRLNRERKSNPYLRKPLHRQSWGTFLGGPVPPIAPSRKPHFGAGFSVRYFVCKFFMCGTGRPSITATFLSHRSGSCDCKCCAWRSAIFVTHKTLDGISTIQAFSRPHAPVDNNTMFRHGARSFVTSARRLAVTPAAAAEPTQHLIAVSKAQGIAKGLTGGKYETYAMSVAL